MVKPVLLRSRYILQHLVAFKHVSDIVTEKRRNETLEQKAVWLEKKERAFCAQRWQTEFGNQKQVKNQST